MVLTASLKLLTLHYLRKFGCHLFFGITFALCKEKRLKPSIRFEEETTHTVFI